MFRNRDVKPRKKSYYPFSKNYPSRRTGTTYAIGESRARREKERRNAVVYAVVLVVVFLVVFAAAFVGISLYERPIDDGSDTVVSADGGLRALYITEDELGGGIAFDLFRSTLEQAQANAVLLDFKNEAGRLCTDTGTDTAGEIGASADSAAAKDTVEQLKAQGYTIVARVYCFRDPLAASLLPGTAVTEADGVTVWLDASARNGGEPWLNPYSETAQRYLLDVIGNAVEFGADAVLLDGVQFPTGELAARATFPGEAESTYSRNAILQSFIERAKTQVGDTPLMVAMPLSAVVAGDTAAYGGGIFDSAADTAAVLLDRTGLSDGTMLGGTAYSSDMDEAVFVSAATAALEERLAQNYRTENVLPILSDTADVSNLANAGIDSYIALRTADTAAQ